MNFLRYFEKKQTTGINRPHLQPGDVVRVESKVTEAEKTRLQTFEGTLLGVRGSGPSTTFTVRREVGSFGVERVFPLYSPLITQIEIVKRQKVRRAKLTYLRQAGRRRFKEDIKAMQRHVREEEDKKRLAEEAKKKEEEEKKKAEKEAIKAAEKDKEEEKIKEQETNTEEETKKEKTQDSKPAEKSQADDKEPKEEKSS
jgi:large subunit ribosomal protein L19